jgi:glycosyltransferase involved in cell wall biosynthesis
MKIAYVYDAAYPYVKGGIEKRVYEIGRRLSARGHEVHWFSIKWWDGPDEVKNDGIIMHGVCRPMRLYNKEGRRSIKAATAFALNVAGPLAKDRYDIIDCQNFPYLSCLPSKTASLKGKTPLIVTWHEVWGNYWYEYLGWKGFFGKTLEGVCAKLTKNQLVVSERTRERLKGLKIKPENITLTKCGIDLKKIQGIMPSDEAFDVLFAGRLVKEKNVDCLIKSIKEVKKDIPHVSLAIIGEGPEKKHLEKLTHDLGLKENVKFLGFQKDHDMVFAYMKSAKIFALPSTREGFSIAALEANACGMPVITIDHPMNAAADLITEEYNGYSIPLSLPEFADKIKLLLQNKNLRERMARNAKIFSMKYSWDTVSEDVERYYEQILSGMPDQQIL